MTKILLPILFILGTATATLAQSDEFVPLPTVTIQMPVNMRRGPSTARARIKVLKSATEVRLVDQSPSGKFYRVILGKGRVGWVSSKSISAPPVLATTETSAAAAPCADSLANCRAEGCAAPGSEQAIFNSTKRRQPSETTARTLSFADLRSLQQKATNLVGQHNQLTQAERDLLVNLSVTSGTVHEGRLVKVRGFLAAGLPPHANSGGESVNCRFTQNENNDFHISIVQNAGEDEFKGIVVEMIPQDRNANWTLTKLKNIRQQGKRILVFGALFYDNIHIVNDDPSHPLGGQPKRVSLWEVHPITRFFVCTKASNNCSVSSTGASSGWKRLEDF